MAKDKDFIVLMKKTGVVKEIKASEYPDVAKEIMSTLTKDDIKNDIKHLEEGWSISLNGINFTAKLN